MIIQQVWENVDWKLSNTEIAANLKISLSTVSLKRKKLRETVSIPARGKSSPRPSKGKTEKIKARIAEMSGLASGDQAKIAREFNLKKKAEKYTYNRHRTLMTNEQWKMVKELRESNLEYTAIFKAMKDAKMMPYTSLYGFCDAYQRGLSRGDF